MNELRSERWLAVGLLLLVLALFGAVAVVPLINAGIDYYETASDLAFRVQRYKRIVARKDDVQENLDQLKEQHDSQGYVTESDTEALASAELQQFIKTTVSDAGGQLASTQVLPSKTENGFLTITVKVRMSGDIEMLRNVLYQIETSVPIMIVDQLDVNPVRGARNRLTHKIEGSNQLNANFQVVGFMRAKNNEQQTR